MDQHFLNDFEKKRQFLLKQEIFFIRGISLWFHLSHAQLRKYQSILNWEFIGSNTFINWNSEIIDEFKDYLFLDPNNEISINEKLPWTIEFLERFEDLWNWELLAQNDAVMQLPDVKNYFYFRLHPYLEEYEFYATRNQKEDESTELLFWESEINKLKTAPELQFQSVADIENAHNIDWLRLSQNELLPWSAELIEWYIDEWHWEWLSINQIIPWDIKLLKKFESRIDWEVEFENEDGLTKIPDGISSNFSIEWDTEILSTFLHKLSPWNISISPSTKWDIDLLIQFQDFWDYKPLALNNHVWEKVFPEFQNEAILNPVLDKLLYIKK